MAFVRVRSTVKYGVLPTYTYLYTCIRTHFSLLSICTYVPYLYVLIFLYYVYVRVIYISTYMYYIPIYIAIIFGHVYLLICTYMSAYLLDTATQYTLNNSRIINYTYVFLVGYVYPKILLHTFVHVVFLLLKTGNSLPRRDLP